MTPTHAILKDSADQPRVLIADDAAVARIFVTGILEVYGYRVDAVDEGRSAVEAAEAVAYDAIVLDLNMPVMDGFEAAAAIRARDADVALFALTSGEFENDWPKCQAAGMDAWLSKPFDIEQFERERRRICRPVVI